MTPHKKLLQFLRYLGWEETHCQGNRTLFYDPSNDFAVAVHNETGKWQLFGEDFGEEEAGYDPEVLESAMIRMGMISPACGHCGERGGEIETVYSREFQGCAEHGGMVERTEQRCSKCAPVLARV